MAKNKKPRDLLDTHAYIERRVLWLEMQSTNEPPENAPLVNHFHDIVEHLFRGSMQGKTGAAPFGHLAAHYWECEHDDPRIASDWEFHRKMRLMRERVGASRKLADLMFGISYGIHTGGLTTLEGKGHHWVDGKEETLTIPYHAPGTGPHHLVFNFGNLWQPFMLPSGPGWYGKSTESFFHYTYKYTRPKSTVEGKEYTEYEKNSEFGPDETLFTESEGPGQKVTEEIATIDNAVGIDVDEMYGNTIGSRSRRWDEKTFNEQYTAAITSPSVGLDGSSAGPFIAEIDSSLTDDILIWSAHGEAESNVGGSLLPLYPLEVGAPSDAIIRGKRELWASNPPSEHSGVYGGMWYLLKGPGGERAETLAYIPADFVQSPGPPEDFDGTQEETIAMPWPEIPEESCSNEWAYFGFGPGLPPNVSLLRTFEEAVDIFEEAIDEPLFADLKAFWERHLKSFTQNGSAFNQEWVLESGNPIERKVRYGFCHLRGRVTLTRGGTSSEAFSSGPAPLAVSQAIGDGGNAVQLDWMCNSSIGLVRVRLTGSTETQYFTLPDFPVYGPGTAGPAWIDVDGISYPCED